MTRALAGQKGACAPAFAAFSRPFPGRRRRYLRLDRQADNPICKTASGRKRNAAGGGFLPLLGAGGVLFRWRGKFAAHGERKRPQGKPRLSRRPGPQERRFSPRAGSSRAATGKERFAQGAAWTGRRSKIDAAGGLAAATQGALAHPRPPRRNPCAAPRRRLDNFVQSPALRPPHRRQGALPPRGKGAPPEPLRRGAPSLKRSSGRSPSSW